MQAIILAAGMGKRLGKLTQHKTKCMLEVHGTTLIELSIKNLLNVGIKKLILVIGYEGDKVKKMLGTNYSGVEIEYIVNDIYFKTNNIYSLYLAREHLLKEDTILLESDLIYDRNILKKILDNPFPNLAVVAKYESWMDGTVVTLNDEHDILRFIPKKYFNYNEIEEYYKTVNIYKFSKEFSTTHYVPFLEAYSSAIGNNEYYEQVLRIITLLEKPQLKALRLENERWYEIDDLQDLHNAETVFSPQERQLKEYQNRYGGYWRFPRMLDFCYLVNPYFPTETMKNEMKYYFGELLSHYPSGLDTQNILASMYFGVDPKQILVTNGATEIIKALDNVISGEFGIIIPTFNEYIERIHKNHLQLFPNTNSDYKYGLKELTQIGTKVDNLILVNPDNPSGSFLSKNEIFELLDFLCKNGKTLILDESFIDFAENGEDQTFLNEAILCKYSNLVVIKSISKSYGVPGLRLGIIASSNESILKDFRNELPIWNINSFAEFFLQIIDKYRESFYDACILIRNERDRFYNLLKRVEFIEVLPSQANYFLCKILKPWNSSKLAKSLFKEDNILIKDLSDKAGFENSQYVRIAIRNKSDNDKLFNALIKRQ